MLKQKKNVACLLHDLIERSKNAFSARKKKILLYQESY